MRVERAGAVPLVLIVPGRRHVNTHYFVTTPDRFHYHQYYRCVCGPARRCSLARVCLSRYCIKSRLPVGRERLSREHMHWAGASPPAAMPPKPESRVAEARRGRCASGPRPRVAASYSEATFLIPYVVAISHHQKNIYAKYVLPECARRAHHTSGYIGF